MDIQQTTNIFRLSATLYANNNYQISPVQLHRKVIEDALFVLNKKDGISIGALADYIEKEYYFTFDEKELKKVLHNLKFSNVFEWKGSANSDIKYFLKKERREQLENRETKTLQDYICEYLTKQRQPIEKAESINYYLYSVFTSNVDIFKRMLVANNIKPLTEHYSHQEQDVDLINGFLDWDNEQKNIAIFNLASYALEFCLLTSKKDSNLKLDSLKHKTFYLDTNILYRAIGINGEDRRLRTISFLRKLKESENEIKISKVTWEEFEGSLNSYVKRLRKSETPAIQSKVYTEYITYDDMYRYYHLWASNRSNATVDLFVDWMEASMKSLIDDFSIQLDTLVPYNIEIEREKLSEMAAQIMGYGKGKLFETAMNDACNINWIEHSRNLGENTLFSTKTFLISSDHGLCVWDAKYHSMETPIVVLPSQWLSLLLRYVARSKDDYRSFVCFLNIQDKEGPLSGEQINAILTGIAEMTNNVEQQRYFLETIIEREFKEGAAGKTNDQLRTIARKKSERLLQNQLDELKADHKDLQNSFSDIKNQFNRHKEETKEMLEEKDQQLLTANEKVDTLNSSVRELKDVLNRTRNGASENERQKDETISQLSKELAREKSKNAFNKAKRYRIFLKSIGVVIIVALVILFFKSSKDSDNCMGKFLTWIDTLENTQQAVARIVLGLVFSAILIPLIISLFKDCVSKYKEVSSK